MPRVAVVTDSVACLPRELVEQYSLRIVPIELTINGSVYRDEVDITPAELYSQLPELKSLPTTSAPSPGAYLETFEALAEETNTILCITISAKLTTVINSARLAIEQAKEVYPQLTIDLLDSRTAAGAQGFVALAAARAAKEGKDLPQVTEAARNVMPRVHVLGILDTLYYLAKGGRIPKAAFWAASFFNIKPVFQVLPLSGEASLATRARSKPKAIECLLKIMRQRSGTDRLHVIVMHTNALEEAEGLKERISSEFNCVEIYIKDYTPVMGIHTGPGLLGTAFYAEEAFQPE